MLLSHKIFSPASHSQNRPSLLTEQISKHDNCKGSVNAKHEISASSVKGKHDNSNGLLKGKISISRHPMLLFSLSISYRISQF